MNGDQWGIILEHIVDEQNRNAVYDIVTPLYITSEFIYGISEKIREDVVKQLSDIGEYKLVELFTP